MVAGHMTKKNGYWYLILMVRDETGRLKQKWISTHLRVEGNKKKAEAMLLAARREYTDFAEIQKRSSDVLVSHYLTTWVKSCRGKVSFGTYEEYQNCINNRIAPYFKERNILLLDLKPADILDYYNSLYAKGLTGNTVLHYHVLLRKALKEASMRGFIQNDPTDFIPRPKKEQSAADCYSPEECRKLLNALHDDPLELPITLAVLYGLRRSEVLGLRWGAIDYERATITISHSVTSTAVNGKRQLIAKDKLKRKSSFRTLPLMPQVAAMLQNAAIQRYGTQPPPSEIQSLHSKIDGLTANLDKMYMDRLTGLLAESDFERIYQRIKMERNSLEEKLKDLEVQKERPVSTEDRARELVQRFITSAYASRELLVSLIERVELTEDKQIIVKFRFRELEAIS